MTSHDLEACIRRHPAGSRRPTDAVRSTRRVIALPLVESGRSVAATSDPPASAVVPRPAGAGDVVSMQVWADLAALTARVQGIVTAHRDASC